MQPLISIIIPAYNIEPYIARCLDSVMQQTYPNLEIIVVNDGSADRTGDIITEYAKKDGRIRAVHKKNGGVSAARNEGIALASGSYIGFVDGDDMIAPDMYEFLLGNMVKYSTDISHCGYRMVFPDRTEDFYGSGKLYIQDTEQGLSDLVEGTLVEPGIWNKLYKAELFAGVRLNTGIRINEDLLLNYYLFKKSEKSVFQDEVKYYYMKRPESATGGKMVSRYMDPVYVLREMMSHEGGKVLRLLKRRYLLTLLNLITAPESEGLRPYRKGLRNEVRDGFSEENSLFSKKEKLMAGLAVHSPVLYRMLHFVYSSIKGTRTRYDIK